MAGLWAAPSVTPLEATNPPVCWTLKCCALRSAGVEEPLDGAQCGSRCPAGVRFGNLDLAFVKKLVPEPGEFLQLLTIVF